MDIVTDRQRNPFDLRPPCSNPCSAHHDAVFGYGDPNADFHLIGDHPGVHGGASTGIPFSDTDAGKRLLAVMESVEFISDWHDGQPVLDNLFMSYLHCCCTDHGEAPTPAAYRSLERFFDAELRAIAAHVLMPVGETAIKHVLHEFTAKAVKLRGKHQTLHADEVKGRGFLVIPIRDPSTWDDVDGHQLESQLSATLATDYRQTSDLTRFLATDDLYYVR